MKVLEEVCKLEVEAKLVLDSKLTVSKEPDVGELKTEAGLEVEMETNVSVKPEMVELINVDAE